MRHSAAHLMAEAVRNLFPGVKVAIGPAIESGFYYDFDVPEPFTPEDLAKIETHMAELTAQDLPFRRDEVSREQAINYFRSEGEAYKVELLEEIPQEKVSLYQQGNFIDLCRGPHMPSTGYHQGLQAHRHLRGLLAGGRTPAHAPAHLRHRLSHPGGTGAPPGTPGGGQTPGPPPPGPGVGAVQHRRGSRAGAGDLPPQGRPAPEPHRGFRAPGASETGLPDGHGPPDAQGRPVETLRPLGQLPGPHVLHRSGRPDATASSP